MKKYIPFHFTRTVVVTCICLSAISSLCQTITVEKKLGKNPTLNKIIEVREIRDSVNKKQDSLMLKLDKAIAAKNRTTIEKKK